MSDFETSRDQQIELSCTEGFERDIKQEEASKFTLEERKRKKRGFISKAHGLQLLVTTEHVPSVTLAMEGIGNRTARY